MTYGFDVWLGVASNTHEISCIPLLEVCFLLKAKDIQAIEVIQRTFTYKITEVPHVNYWERHHELKLYSRETP